MATQKRNALGRGLDALLSMDDVKTEGSSSISEIELAKITVNPNQPRREFDQTALQELADSIAEIGRKDILVELDHFGTTIQIVVFIVNPVTQMKMGHVRANKRNIARREFADAVSDETLANPLRNGDQLVFGMIMPVRRKVFEYKILLRKRRSGCRNNGFVKHDLILLSKERPLVQI